MAWPDLAAALQSRAISTFRDPPAAGSAAPGFLYEPQGIPTFNVQGIFQAPHLEVSFDSLEQPSASEETTLGIRLSELPAGYEVQANKDHVTRLKTGERFLIVGKRPDGEGMLELLLGVE